MKHYENGSWELDLGGICYAELRQLADLLSELAEKGNVDGVEFDYETLHAVFNATTADVNLWDNYGNTTEETEEE